MSDIHDPMYLALAVVQVMMDVAVATCGVDEVSAVKIETEAAEGTVKLDNR